MASELDFQALNVTTPIKNSNAMKCIAVISVLTTSSSTDLGTLLGALGIGGYLTVKADMPANTTGRIYFAFGSSDGTIDDSATGTGNTVCWPLPDGHEMSFRLATGREMTASNVATLCCYKHLHTKGTATGYLRVYRSSLPPDQDAGRAFKLP